MSEPTTFAEVIAAQTEAARSGAIDLMALRIRLLQTELRITALEMNAAKRNKAAVSDLTRVVDLLDKIASQAQRGVK